MQDLSNLKKNQCNKQKEILVKGIQIGKEEIKFLFAVNVIVCEEHLKESRTKTSCS